MQGCVVTGKLGLVDADIVHFIHTIKQKYCAIWAVPTEAYFAPALDLKALRYILDQFLCVERVCSSINETPSELPMIEFPYLLEKQLHNAIFNNIKEDEKQPNTFSIDQIKKDRPNPLVLLSGCFDLIHAGHVHLIESASKYGVRPIVAALSTRGILVQPKNKQRQRPFWNMADRLTIFQELQSKPKVLFFDGPNCLDLIDQLRPDIYVKGELDRGRSIVLQEALLVEQYKGRVVWEENNRFKSSSSAIEQQILSLTQQGD